MQAACPRRGDRGNAGAKVGEQQSQLPMRDGVSGFRKIYDLHDDEVVARRRGSTGSTFGRLLRRLHRSASRATGPMSLVLEHGEIGSDAWWNAIADGRISVHTVTG
jgi:hypothetical protein